MHIEKAWTIRSYLRSFDEKEEQLRKLDSLEELEIVRIITCQIPFFTHMSEIWDVRPYTGSCQMIIY